MVRFSEQLLGGGAETLGLGRTIGKNSAQDITARLAILQDVGLVVREVPITEKNEPRSRNSLYYIADQYIEFWYRYVDPSRSLIARNMGGGLWSKSIQPTLDEYISRPTFERVASQ